jgi:hypothetical protein
MATDKATDNAMGISSKLCFFSRTKRDDVHGAHIVAAETIKSRLASQLRRLSRNQQIELYNLFARVPRTRKMSGTLFEAIGQDVLPEGLNITLLPMVLLTRRPKAERQNPSALVLKPHVSVEQTGAEAPASTASVTDDTNPSCYD